MHGSRTGLFSHWWYLVMEVKSAESFTCTCFSSRLTCRRLSRVLSHAYFLPDSKFSSVLWVVFLKNLFSEVFISIVISHDSCLNKEQRR